jgi:sugar (pentulose or hexulose) kinase
MTGQAVLAIDQGTSGTKAIVVDPVVSSYSGKAGDPGVEPKSER